MTKKLRMGLVVIVLVLVTAFALQNAAIVEIRLLFWEVAIRRSFLIFLVLAIGIMLGWIARSTYRISRIQK